MMIQPTQFLHHRQPMTSRPTPLFGQQANSNPKAEIEPARCNNPKHQPQPGFWERLFKAVWKNRYAAVLGTGLFASAATIGGAALTPYTAPYFIAYESHQPFPSIASVWKQQGIFPGSSEIPDRERTTDDMHPQENPAQQLAERKDHAVMERDFTLQEIAVSVVLGLTGLASADGIGAINRRRKQKTAS